MTRQPTIRDTASAPSVVSVAEAEATLAGFQRQKDELLARKAALADRKRNVAYDAAAGDGTASRLLDGMHQEAVELESRIGSIDDALAEAMRRVEAAKRAEARAADRAKAVELRAALKRFGEHAAGVDAALEVLVSSCNGLQESLTEMHRCGSGGFPSDAQLTSLGSRVLLAALGNTPFRRAFEMLPPDQRSRTMSMVVQQWSDAVERSIQQRLGDQTNEAA
jgi:hypothetical protein